MNNIEFFNIYEDVSKEYAPVPASKIIPEWYKKTQSYMGDGTKKIVDNGTSGTIKKCIPVLDSISSGYLILTHCDISIEWDGISYTYNAPHNNFKFIGHHPLDQALLYPDKGFDITDIPKYINPWGIKTPKGYSCIFLPPMHRENYISILPGIVDTDNYNNPVQLPFIINKKEQDFIIPAGTPIAQVIPFKRESWNKNITENSKYAKITKRLNDSKFFDAYKKIFWAKKEYR